MSSLATRAAATDYGKKRLTTCREDGWIDDDEYKELVKKLPSIVPTAQLPMSKDDAERLILQAVKGKREGDNSVPPALLAALSGSSQPDEASSAAVAAAEADAPVTVVSSSSCSNDAVSASDLIPSHIPSPLAQVGWSPLDALNAYLKKHQQTKLFLADTVVAAQNMASASSISAVVELTNNEVGGVAVQDEHGDVGLMETAAKKRRVEAASHPADADDDAGARDDEMYAGLERRSVLYPQQHYMSSAMFQRY